MNRVLIKHDAILIMENSGCVNVSSFSRDQSRDDVFKQCEFNEVPEIAIECAQVESALLVKGVAF